MNFYMVHQNIVNLERCYNCISIDLELGPHETQPTIHTLSQKEFPNIIPRRFKLDTGEIGIVIPVKSYGHAAPNMVFFQFVSEGRLEVMSGHASPDVEGELENLARLFTSNNKRK